MRVGMSSASISRYARVSPPRVRRLFVLHANLPSAARGAARRCSRAACHDVVVLEKVFSGPEFCASTCFCARSIAFVTCRARGNAVFHPQPLHETRKRSDPKMRIRSSSSDCKLDEPDLPASRAAAQLVSMRRARGARCRCMQPSDVDDFLVLVVGLLFEMGEDAVPVGAGAYRTVEVVEGTNSSSSVKRSSPSQTLGLLFASNCWPP